MTNDELIARAEVVSKDKLWVTVKSDLVPALIAALLAALIAVDPMALAVMP